MKLPAYREGPLAYEDGIDHSQLAWTIRDWRDGLCPFGRLDEGKEVPAKIVAAHARKTEAIIHETSSLAHEKPKLIAVAEYAERVAKIEAAKAAIAKAAKLYHEAGLRYREWYDDAINQPHWQDD